MFLCNKLSNTRFCILNNLLKILTHHMVTKHNKHSHSTHGDNKLLSILTKFTNSNDIIDYNDANELINMLILPSSANITDNYLSAIIRSHLIVLAASSLKHFQPLINYRPTTCTNILQTNEIHETNTIDFIQFTHFIVVHCNNHSYLTHANKFSYWYSDNNPPLLGSATDRKNNDYLQQRAHKYAISLLNKHKDKIWIFSDGSVSGKQREIAGGGYVIAIPSANQHNVTNTDSEHTIIHESSIAFEKCSIAVAEMVSLSTALHKVNELDIPNNSEVIAFCDNQQVVNIANNSVNINSNLYTENLKLQQILFFTKAN